MIKILRIKSYHFYVLKIIINYNLFDRVLSNLFLSENSISKQKTASKAQLRISKNIFKKLLCDCKRSKSLKSEQRYRKNAEFHFSIYSDIVRFAQIDISSYVLIIKVVMITSDQVADIGKQK